VFGEGRFAPGTNDGRRLIAHELAHVIQQRGSSQLIQRKPDSQSSSGVRFSYSVNISTIVDSDQLLLEFIKQYRNVTTDAEAAALRDKEKWNWVGTPPSVTQADVDKGYILININDRSIKPSTLGEKKERAKYLKGLAAGEQAALNEETNRQFWERTQYRVGQKLGASGDDKQMAEYWKVLRDELVRKRQAIEALPPDIQTFLLDEQAPTALDPRTSRQSCELRRR